MKFKRISWEKLEKDCIKLAKEIEKKHKMDRIVCISRGGLPWARVLSDLLKLPVVHLAVESYSDLKQVKKPIITESPKDIPKKENWLVVDDISDTGDTLDLIVDHLKNYRTKKIYTVTPYIKPKTKFIPDFYTDRIDAWVIFPYEIRETYEAFLKMYDKKSDALSNLKKVGFKDWELKDL